MPAVIFSFFEPNGPAINHFTLIAIEKFKKLKMKIFQFAIIASAVHGDGKVSKKRCEQDLMEENMKYCEDHNTSLSGCVDWIKEGLALFSYIYISGHASL